MRGFDRDHLTSFKGGFLTIYFGSTLRCFRIFTKYFRFQFTVAKKKEKQFFHIAGVTLGFATSHVSVEMFKFGFFKRLEGLRMFSSHTSSVNKYVKLKKKNRKYDFRF